MKIFFTRRNKMMVLILLLVIILFFGLKSRFKIDGQKVEVIEETKPVEAVEEAKPLVLNWLSYNEGLALAEKENKYILIDFYTDWCVYCKKMDDETYSKEEVKKIINKNFVVVKVNAESNSKVMENGEEITERELAKLYQVTGYPTTWFLESDHSRVAPLPGYVTTEQFIPVLNYIGEGWHKSISFKEYMEKDNR